MPRVTPTGFRGAFRTDADACAAYSEGAGIARIVPRAVAVPVDASDVVCLLQWAVETSTPVTPRGSASSMANGALGGGVVLDLGALRDPPIVDAAHQVVRCGAGITRHEVAECAARGARREGSGRILLGATDRAQREALRFPIAPSSGPFCTVGGMAATNAAGAHSLKYGAMRHWVTALDCVFADGSRAWVRRGASGDALPDTLAKRLAGIPLLRERAAAMDGPRTRKNSSGYALREFAESGDVLDLVIGSEGTLAIIVAVELALDSPPPGVVTLLAGFPSVYGAARGSALACEAGASACELMDRTFLEIAAESGSSPLGSFHEPAPRARDGGSSPLGGFQEASLHTGERETSPLGSFHEPAPRARDGGSSPLGGFQEASLHTGERETSPLGSFHEAALIIEIEGEPTHLNARASALERSLRAAGATAVLVGLDEESADALWALRHAASPVLARLDPRLKSMQVVEDGAVPPDALPDYVLGVRAALGRSGFRGVLFGHAGDSHVHANALVDVSVPDWQERLRLLFDEVTALTLAMDGTPSAEHGDGRLRAPILERVWGTEGLELMRSVKNAFDPLGLLNPGVKIPLAGQRPWDDVRYDPTLPPLPPRAARVLARVERDRAWNRNRLELLDEER